MNIHLALADGRSNILKVPGSSEEMAARYFSVGFLGARHMSQIQRLFLTKCRNSLKFESLATIIENLSCKKFCMSGLTFPPVFTVTVFLSVEDPNFAFMNKVSSHSASGVSFPSQISCSNSCIAFGAGSGSCVAAAIGLG